MKPRERVIKSLKHEETDRVPLFYSDTPEIEKRLLNDLHLKNRDELLTYLDIDFRWVGPKYVGPLLKIKIQGIGVIFGVLSMSIKKLITT